MDKATQEQIGELMFWQAIFAEDRAAWHKAASAKKWTKKMQTTRDEAIKSANILVGKAQSFGIDPEIVCPVAVSLLKATSKKWAA